MKKLLAGCSLFASTLALGQAVPTPNETGAFWIEGETLTLAYSNFTASAAVSDAAMLQVLADVEADIDALNIASLDVQVDTSVRATSCDERSANTVLVCWGSVEAGNTASFINISGGGGTDYWREATIVLGRDVTWTSTDMMYSTIMHQLLHVVGFSHPDGSGTSVLNGALDLTQLDIDGLRSVYSPSRCTLTYDANQDIVIPYVTYNGNAYRATLHHNGGSSFALASATMYSASSPPVTPCQDLAIDANNQMHLPMVNVNGAIYWGDMTLANGALTLTASGL